MSNEPRITLNLLGFGTLTVPLSWWKRFLGRLANG